MPRLKRVIQRWIISKGAQRKVTVEEAKKSLRARIRWPQWNVREKLNQHSVWKASQEMKNQNTMEKNRFAELRAFRAAGIFGNESRNELISLIRKKNWEELRQKIGERKTNRIRQVLGEARRMADEAENAIFSKDEQRLVLGWPVQNPIHGTIHNMNPHARRKKAA